MIRNFCQAVLRRVFQFFQEFFYFPVFCPERSFFCRILPCRCGNIVRTRVRLRPKSQPCPLPCRSVRENAYLRRHPLSDLRFCLSPLPLYPLPVRSAGLLLLPLPMARERCASLLSPPLSDKGGVVRSAGGDKKARFRYEKLETPTSIRKKSVTCYALFALTRRGVPSRKGRELCPNGAKREGKLRFSGAALRAHAVVSPLKFSAESSLLLFCPAKEKQRNGDVWGGVTK